MYFYYQYHNYLKLNGFNQGSSSFHITVLRILKTFFLEPVKKSWVHLLHSSRIKSYLLRARLLINKLWNETRTVIAKWITLTGRHYQAFSDFQLSSSAALRSWRSCSQDLRSSINTSSNIFRIDPKYNIDFIFAFPAT